MYTLYEFNAPCYTLVGFIDCIIHQTCYPSIYQELAYTGYKKVYGYMFQGMVAPNGLMVHLASLFCAFQND